MKKNINFRNGKTSIKIIKSENLKYLLVVEKYGFQNFSSTHIFKNIDIFSQEIKKNLEISLLVDKVEILKVLNLIRKEFIQNRQLKLF